MAHRTSKHTSLVLSPKVIDLKFPFSSAQLKCISAAALLTASTIARTQSLDARSSTEATGIRFTDFLKQLESVRDSSARNQFAEEYMAKVRNHGRAVIEDSTIYFLYFGNVRRVAVPGDLNGWNPKEDTLTRIPKTNLLYLAKSLHPAARFEYKLAVDSTWILDPLNRQQAIGGYGANSEIWMPLYKPPTEIEYRAEIPHGRIDSLRIKSKLLQRTHPVFVYLPPGYKQSSRKQYPTLYVTDGGEYITLALMLNVLDNLIGEKRIEPIVAVFVDPRTDVRDIRTSKRMFDYTMSDTFVAFLVNEVRALVAKKYRTDLRAERTAIMGASLGALISTYAAFTRPDVFGLVAAQSPSYWWRNDTMITMVERSPKKNLRFYIDTGTIRDAQEKALKMKDVLERKGYAVHYEEHPEAHNWVNWRSRLSHILEYFWGKR